MKKSAIPFLVTAFAALAPYSAHSVTIANQPAPPIINAPNIVERGGVIHRIDAANRVIVIEGASYVYNEASVEIHAPDQSKSVSIQKIRPGMKIRFSTTAGASPKMDRIKEIWISQ